jgi:hypothetical protein
MCVVTGASKWGHCASLLATSSSRTAGCIYSQATFIRWQQQVQIHDVSFHLPFLGVELSVDQVRRELNTATTHFRRLQKQSTPLRLQCYEDLLEAYRDDTNPETMKESRRKEKIILNTISGETTRQTFGHIRRIVKPSERSSLSKVLVPPALMASESEYSSYNITQATEPGDIPWETVFTRDELESHILQYNRDSFRATSESPCGHGIIHDALTFTSLSPQSEALLPGIIPDNWFGTDNYLREFLASFIIPRQSRPTVISPRVSHPMTFFAASKGGRNRHLLLQAAAISGIIVRSFSIQFY